MKRKLIAGITLIALTTIFAVQLTQANVGTEGKACPDINNDCCCEMGSGNCSAAAVVTYPR